MPLTPSLRHALSFASTLLAPLDLWFGPGCKGRCLLASQGRGRTLLQPIIAVEWNADNDLFGCIRPRTEHTRFEPVHGSKADHQAGLETSRTFNLSTIIRVFRSAIARLRQGTRYPLPSTPCTVWVRRSTRRRQFHSPQEATGGCEAARHRRNT